MSEPIVFISHSRIKEGQLEGFKRHFLEGSKSLEEGKPGTVVFLAFLNDDATEVTIVHIFPDADSMERHMHGAAERASAAFEFIETIRLEVYGSPSDRSLEVMREASRSGVPLTLHPEHLGGFLRLTSG